MEGHLQIAVLEVQLGEDRAALDLASEVTHVGHQILVH